MAPEALNNTDYDELRDIYSFAICLFEMLFPFPTELPKEGTFLPSTVATTSHIPSGITYAQNVTNGWRPPFPTFPSQEHSEFARLIQQCWSHDPSKRPSASTALAELFKIRPNQKSKQEVKDGKDRIKLLVRGEEFIARRSTLVRVRRSQLWELFAGGREKDPPAKEDGFVELDAEPLRFEKALGFLQMLDTDGDVALISAGAKRLAVPLK